MGDFTDTLYCCGSDFYFNNKKAKWCSDIEVLKSMRPCWEHCGIKEVVFDHHGEIIWENWIKTEDIK